MLLNINGIINDLDFYLKNFDFIINTPNYYFILLEEARISSAFRGVDRSQLYLGELLTLYSQDKWISTCPHCGGRVYLKSLGGSPLSGRGSGTGYCRDCRKTISGIKPFERYFGEFMGLRGEDGEVC